MVENLISELQDCSDGDLPGLLEAGIADALRARIETAKANALRLETRRAVVAPEHHGKLYIETAKSFEFETAEAHPMIVGNIALMVHMVNATQSFPSGADERQDFMMCLLDQAGAKQVDFVGVQAEKKVWTN